jgi:hypothetical protein
MKNFFKAVLLVGIAAVAVILLKNSYIENGLAVKDDKLSYAVKYKGISNAVDFTFDKQGNFFIAFKDKIQYIDSSGKSYDLLKDSNLSITSIDYKDDKLFYTTGVKIMSFDINTKQQKELMNGLPNFGDYMDSLLKVRGNELYITIGAATNSGVVGSDNMWLASNPFSHDISPKDITINGKNFGSEKTGAFVAYKTKNLTGQLIPAHFPGNASVIIYNLSTGASETFAWGIRNIKGMAFNSESKLIAAVGGMEERGLRPVKGDVDYIFELKKNAWYGWPDYSGGDPLTSPRFKGENNSRLSFVLDNHPTTNPPGPIYLHKSLSALGAMDIDIKGKLGEKDCIYFYDTRDNMIYGLTRNNVLTEKASFSQDSKVLSLKLKDEEMLALDSSKGILYSIGTSRVNNAQASSKAVVYYLIIVTLIGIFIAVWKFNGDSSK